MRTPSRLLHSLAASLLVLGCGDPSAQTPSPDTTTGESTGVDEAPETSATTTADGTSGTDEPGSSSGTDPLDTGSTSPEGTDGGTTDTGTTADCDGIETSVLFSSAGSVGSPGDSFLLYLLSWWNQNSGDYDESADDFEVPPGLCWCISEVSIVAGYAPGPAPETQEFVVNLYDDAGDLPNTRYFSETTTQASSEPWTLDNLYTISLAEPVVAPPGRSWVSVLGITQAGERLGIRLSTAPTTSPSAAHLDLMDCDAFTHFEDCYPGQPATQLAFEIHGAEVACGADG